MRVPSKKYALHPMCLPLRTGAGERGKSSCDLSTAGLLPAAALFRRAPLIEDNSVRSSPTRIVNADVGYRFANGISASVTALNLFDSRSNDITYFYESQLPGEAVPVADRHFILWSRAHFA
jgi:hypothetical protein